MAVRGGIPAIIIVLSVVACGVSASSSESSDGAPASPKSPGAASDAGGFFGDAASPPPPEREVESSFEAPVATGSYVWVTNPKSGRVAYIDVRSLAVKTVEAGNGPTYLAAVPGAQVDTTVVLNVLSRDATVLRASPTGIDVKTVKIANGANSWAFSADGRYAIAWADAK